VKTQREDRVSKANFDYRYRARTEHFADLAVVSDDYFGAEEIDIVDTEAMLAMVGARWCTPTPRRDDSTAHWLPSRRPDGPGAYPVVGEHSPAVVVIRSTAAVDQTDYPEKTHGTTNVALSQGISGHGFRRCPSLYGTGRDSTRSSTS
jgi:hypothetical protein